MLLCCSLVDLMRASGGRIHSNCLGCGKLYQEEPAWRDIVQKHDGIVGLCEQLGCMHVENQVYFVLDEPSDPLAVFQRRLLEIIEGSDGMLHVSIFGKLCNPMWQHEELVENVPM